MTLALKILGRQFGDFNRRHAEPHTLGRQVAAALGMGTPPRGPHSPTRVFAPTAEFTNRVVRLGEDDRPRGPDVVGTAHPADGGVAEGIGTAVALTNADCPMICLYAGERLAVLHGGFRCLLRERADEPNIIEAALRYFPNLGEISAWIGYGIGPCCWHPGLETKPEILGSRWSRHADLLATSLAKTTAASPFGPGQISVDLYALARGLLQEAGIAEDHITVDARCTCCAVDPHGAHPYWSHTRHRKDGGTDGSNLSVFWLEPADEPG